MCNKKFDFVSYLPGCMEKPPKSLLRSPNPGLGFCISLTLILKQNHAANTSDRKRNPSSPDIRCFYFWVTHLEASTSACFLLNFGAPVRGEQLETAEVQLSELPLSQRMQTTSPGAAHKSCSNPKLWGESIKSKRLGLKTFKSYRISV